LTLSVIVRVLPSTMVSEANMYVTSDQHLL
jgi:hypothetical protein